MKNVLHLMNLVTLVSCQQRQEKAFEAEKVNILFVLADDMGWQDTSVLSGPSRTRWNDRYYTTALQWLADEGIKFTQAYASAVSSPSKVSLTNGQNEATHHVTQWTYLNFGAKFAHTFGILSPCPIEFD